MFGNIATYYLVDPTGKPNIYPGYLSGLHHGWIRGMSEHNRDVFSLTDELSTRTATYRSYSYDKDWFIKLNTKDNTMPSTCNCTNCNSEITNPDFKVILYQPGYESIDIGPYCPDCFVKVKVCSGCQHPFIGEENIRHYGNGRHFCGSCASSLEMCGECGSEERIKATINGKKYCPGCYSKTFFKCGYCGEVHEKNDNSFSDLERVKKKGVFKKYGEVCRPCYSKVNSRFKTYDVKTCRHCSGIFAGGDRQIYCDGCLRGFNSCQICGHKHPHVETKNIDDDTSARMCKSCTSRYSECDCGRLTKEPISIHGASKVHRVCKVCADNEHGECRACHSVRKLRDEYCEVCTRTYKNNTCFECGSVKDSAGNCRSCGNVRIYGYSTKPNIYFHKTDKDVKYGETLYFGFENEMYFPNGHNSALKRIYKAFDPTMVIAKDDSSIPSSAFEVVTQPMTLNFFHKTKWAPLFAGDPKHNDSCGLHIHVDRGAFKGDVHIYKICNFVHGEAAFVDNIVGRSAGAYNSNFRDKPSKTVKDAKKGSAQRGYRVNLSNDKTIEFRMFSTCHTEYQLQYRVEWLHALIKFCEAMPISSIKKSVFIDYVTKEKKRYPSLHQFICNSTS